MLGGESGVVERRAALDAVGEIVAGVGIRDRADVACEVAEFGALVGGQVGFDDAGLSLRCRLGVASGVDEDERRAALAQRVVDEGFGLSLTAATGTSR